MFSNEYIGRFSEKMLRLFKTIWHAAGFSVDHSLTAELFCPSPGRRFWMPSEWESGAAPETLAGGLPARAGPGRRRPVQLGHQSQPLAQKCGVKERSSLWSHRGRTFLPCWCLRTPQCSMRMELESRANSFLKRMEELEVS